MEYHQNRYARELEKEVLDGTRWLDIGAGRKFHGGWEQRPQVELASRAMLLVGADIEEGHLRAHPHLRCRVICDATALPFADHTFSIVTANMVVEHLAEPVVALSEIARVLLRGGRFLFVTPNRGSPAVYGMALLVHPRIRSRLARISDGRAAEHIFRTHYQCNTAGAVNSAAQAAGFHVALIESFSSFPISKNIPLLRSIEMLWIRAIERDWGRSLRSNLLVVLERDPPGGPPA